VVHPIVGGEEIKRLQGLVREVSISEDMIRYVAALIRATRPDEGASAYVREWVRWGAGPRAGQALILTAKARALFRQRYAVTMEDIQMMARPVLRHRILMNFKAEAEDIQSDDVTAYLLKTVERPAGLLK
jgi:MoxR-like ATPase